MSDHMQFKLILNNKREHRPYLYHLFWLIIVEHKCQRIGSYPKPLFCKALTKALTRLQLLINWPYSFLNCKTCIGEMFSRWRLSVFAFHIFDGVTQSIAHKFMFKCEVEEQFFIGHGPVCLLFLTLTISYIFYQFPYYSILDPLLCLR